MSRMRAAAVLLAAALAAGCTSLAQRIAEPEGGSLLPERALHDFDQSFGVSRARMHTRAGHELAYRVVEPAEYAVDYEYRRSGDAQRFNLTARSSHEAAPLPARGTVIYLHGWGMDGSSLLPWALALGERGFRGVLPDLRNHGDSGRAPAGYGVREAGDIVDLVRHLHMQHRLQEPVYLFGYSMGAATALFAADELAPRAAGVIAISPYANAADGIGDMVHAMLESGSRDSPAFRWSKNVARRHYDDAAIARAIGEAGQQLDLDLSSVDVTAAAAAAPGCLLLLHGERDSMIPSTHSRRIAAAAPQLHYVPLPDEDHISLPARVDWLAAPIAQWMDEVARGSCTSLQLPKDPATHDLGERQHASPQ